MKKRWIKQFLVVAMLLVLLATTTVYLTPLDVYVPEIEQSLSVNFNEPVKIRHLKVELLPLPHLELEQVQMGGEADTALQSVKIFFSWRSLLASQHVIRRLVIAQGHTTQAQLQKIFSLQGGGNGTADFMRVEEVKFNGILVATPAFVLGPLDGQLNLAADNSLIRAWVTMADHSVAAMIYPQPAGAFRIEAGARNWSPPGFPGLVLDSMSATGILAGQQFNAGKFTAEALGMHFSGTGSVAWQPEWKLGIRLDAADGRIDRLLALLDKRIVATGMLHAQGRLDAHGDELSAFSNSLHFDADMEVKEATLRLPLNAQRSLLIDSVKSHVAGSLQRIALDNLSASLYGGTLLGSAVLQRPEEVLDMDLRSSNIAVQPLVEAFGQGVLLTGSLSSRSRCSVRLNDFGQYPGNVKLDGSFSLRHGVIGKMDLVQAVNNPLKGAVKGGKTSFDELSGLLSIDGNGYHLSKLKISSGAASATGKLDISPQLQLDGMLDTELKGTARLVSMPLKISGTVSDPVLRPAGPVLAGAAVGTALLGPGLGTAVGIEIGNLLHKLFGAASNQKKHTPAQSGQADKSK